MTPIKSPAADRALLQKLKTDTNAAIDLTRTVGLDEAINWADLRCVEASYVLDDTGHEYWRVLIEEADPAGNKFRELIRSALELRGWQRVEVVTEW